MPAQTVVPEAPGKVTRTVSLGTSEAGRHDALQTESRYLAVKEFDQKQQERLQKTGGRLRTIFFSIVEPLRRSKRAERICKSLESSGGTPSLTLAQSAAQEVNRGTASRSSQETPRSDAHTEMHKVAEDGHETRMGEKVIERIVAGSTFHEELGRRLMSPEVRQALEAVKNAEGKGDKEQGRAERQLHQAVRAQLREVARDPQFKDDPTVREFFGEDATRAEVYDTVVGISELAKEIYKQSGNFQENLKQFELTLEKEFARSGRLEKFYKTAPKFFALQYARTALALGGMAFFAVNPLTGLPLLATVGIVGVSTYFVQRHKLRFERGIRQIDKARGIDGPSNHDRRLLQNIWGQVDWDADDKTFASQVRRVAGQRAVISSAMTLVFGEIGRGVADVAAGHAWNPISGLVESGNHVAHAASSHGQMIELAQTGEGNKSGGLVNMAVQGFQNQDVQQSFRDISSGIAKPADITDLTLKVNGDLSRAAGDLVQATTVKGEDIARNLWTEAGQVAAAVHSKTSEIAGSGGHGDTLPYQDVKLEGPHGHQYYEIFDRHGHHVEIPENSLPKGTKLVEMKNEPGVYEVVSKTNPYRVYATDVHIDSESFTAAHPDAGIDAHVLVPLKDLNSKVPDAYLKIKGDIQLGRVKDGGVFNFGHQPGYGPPDGWFGGHDEAYLRMLDHMVIDPKLPGPIVLNGNMDYANIHGYGVLFDGRPGSSYGHVLGIINLNNSIQEGLGRFNAPHLIGGHYQTNESFPLQGNFHLNLYNVSDKNLYIGNGLDLSVAIAHLHPNEIQIYSPNGEYLVVDSATNIGSPNGHGPFPSSDYFYAHGSATSLEKGITGLNPNETDGLQHVIDLTSNEHPIPGFLNPPSRGPFAFDINNPLDRNGLIGLAGVTLAAIAARMLYRNAKKAKQQAKPTVTPKPGTPSKIAAALGRLPLIGKKKGIPPPPIGTGKQAPKFVGPAVLTSIPAGLALDKKLKDSDAADAAKAVKDKGGKTADNKEVTEDQVKKAHSAINSAVGSTTPSTLSEAESAGSSAARAIFALPIEDQLNLADRANAELVAAMLIPAGNNISREYVADHIQRIGLAHKGIEDAIRNGTGGGAGGLSAIAGSEPSGQKGKDNPMVVLRQLSALKAVMDPSNTGVVDTELQDAFDAQGYTAPCRAVIAAELHRPTPGLSTQAQAQERISAGFANVFGGTIPTTDEIIKVAQGINSAVVGESHLGKDDAERQQNIVDALEKIPTSVVTIAQKARVIAELTPGDHRAKVAKALEYYNQHAMTVPPSATPQDLAEIVQDLQQSMNISGGLIRQERTKYSSTNAHSEADEARAAAKADTTSGSRPEAMKKAIETRLQKDPATGRMLPQKIGETLFLMQLDGASDVDILATIESLKLTPKERSAVAREMLQRLSKNGTAPITPEVLKTVIAAAGLKDQSGEPTLTVDGETTRTIRELGDQLNRYNVDGGPRSASGSSTGPSHQIKDVAKEINGMLNLSIESRCALAESIIKDNKGKKSAQLRLAEVFRIAISPDSTSDEIAKVMKVVQESSEWGDTERISSSDLKSLLGILDITDLQKQATIYTKFLETSGNTSAKRVEETIALLLNATSSGTQIVNVVRGIKLSEGEDEPLIKAIRAVATGRSASSIISAVTKLNLSTRETAELTVLATSPDANYKDLQSLLGLLKAAKIPEGEIYDAMRQLKIPAADRERIVKEAIQANKGLIPHPDTRTKGSNTTINNESDIQKKAVQVVQDALIMVGCPKFHDLGSDLDNLKSDIESELTTVLGSSLGSGIDKRLIRPIVVRAINEIISASINS